MKTPFVMGILNVTPDSFSDGGKFLSLDESLKRAECLLKEGADIIDVGGESTRPGSQPVSEQEELDRVIPVIEGVATMASVPISIDTRKAGVAKEALAKGASIVNDVSGGSDIRMAGIIREHNAKIILMHMLGNPQTMQQDPVYPGGVVADIKDFLRKRVRAFQEIGVSKENIWVDPGIGFGKTLAHNLELLKYLDRFSALAERVVIGTSRKSFLGHLLEKPDLPFQLREDGTRASGLWAYMKGASVFRVHDVGSMKRALKTWDAIANASE